MHWCKSYKKNTVVLCSVPYVKRKTFRSLTNGKSIKIVGQKLLALASQML